MISLFGNDVLGSQVLYEEIFEILEEREGSVNLTQEQEEIYSSFFMPHGITPKQFEFIIGEFDCKDRILNPQNQKWFNMKGVRRAARLRQGVRQSNAESVRCRP